MVIAIGMFYYTHHNNPPDPAYANRQQLFYWLIYVDLSAQPMQTRLVLANRLEEECCNGLDWQSVDVKLDKPQQDRLWSNIPLILRPWFVDKARFYSNLRPEKRQDYVDRLIDIITAWQGIEKLLPNRLQGSTGGKASDGVTNLFLDEIERVQKESDTTEREQIGALWNALKLRWLVRNLTSPSAN